LRRNRRANASVPVANLLSRRIQGVPELDFKVTFRESPALQQTYFSGYKPLTGAILFSFAVDQSWARKSALQSKCRPSAPRILLFVPNPKTKKGKIHAHIGMHLLKKDRTAWLLIASIHGCRAH
jgi:hypothetical protein